MTESQDKPATGTPSSVHKRRVRYPGKYPKKFDHKYKELQADRFPSTVSKVEAAGKTAAGTHRPIMVNEILEVLHLAPGKTGADCTLGFGGHALAILKTIQPDGKLIGLDVDSKELPKTTSRLLAEGFDERTFVPRLSNFAGLPKILGSLDVPGLDFVFADLGCSSMQYDDPQRGFSYKHDGPLDMRLNPQRGEPAFVLLQKWDVSKLAAILSANSDEPESARLAEGIIGKAKNIKTTRQLSSIIEKILPGNYPAQELKSTFARVFQALRIEVNQEFTALEMFLRNLPMVTKPGGRVAILTFHSGEDRRVKKSFREYIASGVFSEISEDVTRASMDEQRQNPRSSSAKLRWAQRA
ncbi:MAG: Ribosomal small subunit methyltransferase [Verrucomicrobiales bacterium]|nr:Ribosomal small subunit methyltransferase [Verrucomicrobiales bacterium]